MKKLFLSLIFFTALLIVGCQENSITNPVPDSADINKSDASTASGFIKLQNSLQSPYQVFNSYFDISGVINYSIEVHQLDPIPPNSQELISLQLSIDAELTNVCTVCSPLSNETPAGTISGEINDVINFSDDTQHAVTKTFAIDKRTDGMTLKVSFLVTTSSVTVDYMKLELPDSKADVSTL